MKTSRSSFLLQEAILLHQRGAVADAAARYAEVLRQDRRNVDALFLLGMACGQQGRFEESAGFLRKAIKVAPTHAPAHNYLGVALQQLQKADEALKCFERAIRYKPDLVEAYVNRANLLMARGEAAEAVTACDRLIALAPNLPEAHANRANALAALGRHAEAVASYDQAIALRGDFAEAHVNRGNSLRALDRFDEALASYERAVALRPDLVDARFSIGLALEDQCRFAEANESFTRAIAAAPPGSPPRVLARLHLRRAVGFHNVGRFAESLADVAEIARLAPDDDEMLYAVSFIDRAHGRWREAWPKHERRTSFRVVTPPVLARHPLWAGEDLDAGETLLLRGEEGLGDQINFCCFVPHLAARGLRIALWPDPKLVPLLRSVRGVAEVIASPGEIERLGRLRWLNIMTVPHILGTTPDTIPQDGPYLSAEPARVEAWKARLGAHGFKVGIHWQGNPKMRQDRIRSMPLAAFEPLAGIPDIRLISLQKQPGSRQIAEVGFGTRIERPLDDADISAEATLETAALMANLDLIVSGDSMVPHLAGALGRPIFLAAMHVPDWRWLLDRDDSPWYPTMRLFRQPQPEDWTDVFRRIADAVRAMAAQG